MRATQPASKAKPIPKKRSRTPPGVQSLLILHLNGQKLREDGLHLGDAAHVSVAISAWGLGARVVVTDTTSSAELNSARAELVKRKQKFDVVVAIGHSHAGGIRMANDHENVAGWSAFAQYLKPFRPRRLLLVACKAGRWDAGEALFTDLAQLRRIYACPVNASKDFGALMVFAVPYVVAERRPDDKIVTWAQIAAIAMTGRQLREWRRTTDKGNPDSAVFDLIADLADPVARKVPETLLSIFRPKS